MRRGGPRAEHPGAAAGVVPGAAAAGAGSVGGGVAERRPRRGHIPGVCEEKSRTPCYLAKLGMEFATIIIEQ